MDSVSFICICYLRNISQVRSDEQATNTVFIGFLIIGYIDRYVYRPPEISC